VHPNGDEVAWTSVSVAGTPAVTFCLEPAAGDPVAAWLLDNGWIDEPVMRAFLGLVEPGMRVLDLGCHLGTFSLPAAGLGAEVLALDANPRHVGWVTAAAERNGFDDLLVVHGAISDDGEPVAFLERGIHGRRWTEGDGADAARTVAPVTVDALLEARGWDGLDLVKMDVEGSEPAVLRGMAQMFARGVRPAFVFECNATTLPLFGSTTRELRTTLADLGYELLLIDHLRPGTLVEASAETIQSEAVSDYLALPTRPAALADRWRIEPPFTTPQMVARVLDTASGEGDGYRLHAARLIADGPTWLRRHPAMDAARWALRLDETDVVRGAFAPGAGPFPEHDAALAPEPAGGDRPDPVLRCEAVAVATPSGEPDRPNDEPPPHPADLALRGGSFHAGAGQLVGVLATDPAGPSLLLRAIAGRLRPVAGVALTTRRAELVTLDDATEPGCTVATNLALLAALHGAHVPAVNRRMDELCTWAGVEGLQEVALADAPVGTRTRIALVAALVCATPGLVLVDALEPVDDDGLRARLRARADELRAAGTAIVQVVTDPAELLSAPDRIVWVDDGEVMAAGHPRSVLAAVDRLAAALGRAA
jgi:FkbM family methyltransferase